MSDSMRAMWVAILLPITWLALSYFVINPVTKLVKKHASPRLAKILTKKYFEDPKCPP